MKTHQPRPEGIRYWASIGLGTDLHERLRLYCKARRVTMSSVVEVLVTSFLDAEEKGP